MKGYLQSKLIITTVNKSFYKLSLDLSRHMITTFVYRSRSITFNATISGAIAMAKPSSSPLFSITDLR